MSFGFATSRSCLGTVLRWFAHPCPRRRTHVLSFGLNSTPCRARHPRRISKLAGAPVATTAATRRFVRRPHDGPSPQSSLSTIARRPLPPDIHALANGRLWTWASYVRGPAARQWRHTATSSAAATTSTTTSATFPPALVTVSGTALLVVVVVVVTRQWLWTHNQTSPGTDSGYVAQR